MHYISVAKSPFRSFYMPSKGRLNVSECIHVEFLLHVFCALLKLFVNPYFLVAVLSSYCRRLNCHWKNNELYLIFLYINLKFMKELIDLTDKLAKKHGSLVHKANAKHHHSDNSFDCFYTFALSFTLFVMAMEPLFIFVWQFI